MSINVIGAGFGRTRTMSTQEALNILGFPCYHMKEVLNKENKGHLKFWLNVARSEEGVQHDWPKVFENYHATMDFPASYVWREQFEFHPDAKVIITLHPKGPIAWYQSAMETIYFSEKYWHFKVIKFFLPPAKKLGEMTHKLIWQRSLRGSMEDRDRAIDEYQKRIDEVQATVPSERLLVFSVDQGWEPLCKFLEVEIPQQEFPRVNDRSETIRMISRMKYLAYALIGLSVLALLGLVSLAKL